jgi:hypothetical protein
VGRIISLSIDRGNGFLRVFFSFENNDFVDMPSEVQKHVFRCSRHVLNPDPASASPTEINSDVQICNRATF